MISGSLARRYVKPLFDVALEKDVIDQVNDDLAQIDLTLADNPELKGLINNPSIDRQAKQGIAEDVFAGMSPYTRNFLRVLLDKNRPEVLSEASRLYGEMLNEHRGVTPGLVETAVKIDAATLDRIKSSLEARFECKLELESGIDPSLIGGVRIRVGNTVIDGSVKGKLRRLKTRLINI